MTHMFYAAEAIAEGVSDLKLEEMSLDLPAHTIMFYMMSYVSFFIAGILMMDQYFGKYLSNIYISPQNANIRSVTRGGGGQWSQKTPHLG